MICRVRGTGALVIVSIPFKRESLSKGLGENIQTKRVEYGFNSLQTGKSIQSSAAAPPLHRAQNSFNSLQTGKSIQSLYDNLEAALRQIKVSIPFKRESLSKEMLKSSGAVSRSSFNSLQTGKSIQRRSQLRNHKRNEQVSIPFKRESLSKGKFRKHWKN